MCGAQELPHPFPLPHLPHSFTLDLEKGSASRMPLFGDTEEEAEFLNVNPRCLRKEHRWVYALAGHVYEPGSSIVKIDAASAGGGGGADVVARWGPIDGQIPSEPVFVPRPGGTMEDDGVLITVVVDKSDAAGADGASYALVLDGQTMEEVARVAAPDVVNFGLHNHWFQPGLLSRI